MLVEALSLLFEYKWTVLGLISVIYVIHSYLTAPKRFPAPRVSLNEVNQRPRDFTGQEILCKSPTTGTLLGKDYAATPEEVNAVVAKAREAQKKWKKTSFNERRAVLHDLLEAIVANRKEIAQASHLDTGKSNFELLMGEIMVSCEKIRYTIRHGEDSLKPQYRKVPLLFLLGGKYARLEYHPLGVIGIIVPWNYPFHNFLSHIVSAIFAGNAAVVKFSEFSSYSRRFYQEIVQKVLVARGHDPNLVQAIPGFGATGAALVASRGIDKILFIGSPQTGARVMKAASDTLKPVVLELGGKDPFIVIAPCDIDSCVDRAINGSFFNLGQNCISAERILVDKKIFEEFSKKLVERMAGMRQGVDGTSAVDFGTITVPSQVDKVKELLDDAISKGAKVLWGGSQNKKFTENKLFFEPTIITNLNKKMRVWTEELFGPVMLLIPFGSVEEAIEIANDTPFGLGSSILSKNLKQAEYVASQLETGMCVINDYGMNYMMQDLPFGGCKDSGFGRFNGPEGLREFCHIKSITGEFFSPHPAMGFPRLMRRPVMDIAPLVINELVDVFYGWGITVKVNALINVVKILLRGK